MKREACECVWVLIPHGTFTPFLLHTLPFQRLASENLYKHNVVITALAPDPNLNGRLSSDFSEPWIILLMN